MSALGNRRMKDYGGNLPSQRSARSRRFIAIIILADSGEGVGEGEEGAGRKGEREIKQYDDDDREGPVEREKREERIEDRGKHRERKRDRES